MKKKSIEFVGHRGWPEKFPENSLEGILATCDLGAHGVEFDLQLTKDRVPVVCHDMSLARTAGISKNICDLNFSYLSQFSAHEPDRFKEKYFPCAISSLEDVSESLSNRDIDIYVEIKKESLEKFGTESTLLSVLEASKAITEKRIIISFDYEVIKLAKAKYKLRTGWVVKTYNEKSKKLAEELNPEFLICNYKKFPKTDPIWSGDWLWFVYDIVDPLEVDVLFEKGVSIVESWDLKALLNNSIEQTKR